MCISKNSVFLLTSVSLFIFFSGCKEKEQTQRALIQKVGVIKAEQKDVPLEIEVPAKITGSLEIQVRAQVSGILKSRTFNEGEYVRQGEKLFEIDREQYEAALTRAKGALAQAESEVRRTTRDYERMKKLHKAGAISQKDHDDSLSAYERAQANLKVAEGSVKEAEINLGYTEVKAPISGIVRKEAQSVGNLVTANTESSLLTSMVQIKPLHAVFSLPGALWNTLAKGKISGKVQLPKFEKCKIEVIMSDGTKYPESGKIIFTDSTEDNLTSSVSIKAEIPSDENQRILLPGQFVRVKVVGAEYNDAIVIPASALIPTALGYVVYVINEDKIVEVRPVKAELVGNNGIINEGLKEGEIVIYDGLSKVRPGEKVDPIMKLSEIDDNNNSDSSDNSQIDANSGSK